MASNLIYSTKLRDLRPVIRYGQPVYTRNVNIRNIIKNKLGDAYANFIAEPVISKAALEGKEEARWFAENMKNAKPFTKLALKKQEEIADLIGERVTKILELANQLKAENDPEHQQLGELLGFAVELPALEYVYVDGDQVCLVAWGFTSDSAKKSHFRLSSYQMPAKKVTALPHEERTHKWKYVAVSFFYIIVFLGILAYFFDENDLPENPGLAPVDAKKIGDSPDDPINRKIVLNRLTLILSQGVELADFVKKIKSQYPTIKFVGYEPELNMLQAEVLEEKREEWKEKLENHSDVELVLYDTLLKEHFLPNESTYWLHSVKAPEAWQISQGSNDIIIAVLDSGFDVEHTVFKNKIVSPWNVVTKNQVLSQQNIHGTHVSGIATATCPKCKLMPIQLSDSEGNLATTSLISGLMYAAKNGAAIINLSLGSGFQYDFSALNKKEREKFLKMVEKMTKSEEILWNRLFKKLSEKGIVIVQAAGNENVPIQIDPMKRSKETIIVAATDKNNQKATFSNYGADLSAPGYQIYSTVPNNYFGYLNGTSMAAPIVAGGVGLLLSQQRHLDVHQVKSILIKTGLPSESVAPILQLDAALTPPCEEENRRLKEEIERLKAQREGMIIPPEKPKSFEFAEGRWRSSNDLLKKADNTPIKLYFEISRTGQGKLTLVEQSGTKCEAKIALSFEGTKLKMEQLAHAVCDDNQTIYNAYLFACESTANDVAKCEAVAKEGDQPLVSFSLFR